MYGTFETSGKNAPSKNAIPSTIGVYILAALFTKVSVFAFLSVAFSTNSSILLTVLFSYFLVTLISRRPSKTMLPDKTLAPIWTLCGFASPVKDAVFKLASPFTTIPSNGTFSPCFTITIWFTFTSWGLTTFISSCNFKFA